MKKLLNAIILSLITAAGLSSQNIVIPADFDWANIPSVYSNETLEIKYHFTPSGADIYLPDYLTLAFTGGSIKNFKSLTGNYTTIVAGESEIFNPNDNITGTFVNTVALPEWFGAKGDNRSNDAPAVAAAVRSFPKVLFKRKYYIPNTIINIVKPVELTGAQNALIRGDGGNVGRFSVKNSITVQNLNFDSFRFCFFFDHDDIISNVKFLNNSFTNIEKPVFAPNNNYIQKLFGVQISNNIFTLCTAGVELFCYLNNVQIDNNKFQNLGNPDLQNQANAIRLGNSWFDYHNDTNIGDFSIYGNSIRDVRCGRHLPGPEGFECHGILVIGNRVQIFNNHIENVYNGGVKDNPRLKTGSEGIYIKANDCRIYNNTLINAGFGEGAICVKGFNTGIVIENNTVQYLDDIADHSQLITCYFAGQLIISGNTLESIAANTTGIKLSTSDKIPSNALIKDNNKLKVNGYGFKILNLYEGNEITVINNRNIEVDGEILKEESKRNYSLTFESNSMAVRNGVFMPSSRFNSLNFNKNKLTAIENTKINNLYNNTEIHENIFNILSSSPNPLFVDRQTTNFTNNNLNIDGSWRIILNIIGDQPGIIADNTFNLNAKVGNIERVIFLNSPTPGLSANIENNRFKCTSYQKETRMVAVSNAGLYILTLSGNVAESRAGIFLDIAPSSKVKYGCFINNSTRCGGGFATDATMMRIEEFYSCGNSQLPDNH